MHPKLLQSPHQVLPQVVTRKQIQRKYLSQENLFRRFPVELEELTAQVVNEKIFKIYKLFSNFLLVATNAEVIVTTAASMRVLNVLRHWVTKHPMVIAKK